MKNRLNLTGLAKILCLSLVGLLTYGCSYYGGKFSSFDLTDDSKKNLANRQASDKFWKSVRLKSNLSDAHYRLGLHYQHVGAHDKAIGEFRKALQNDKSYCKAFNGIAMTYDLMKRCESAHDSYERAIQCAPGEAYVYNNYACSSLLCGHYGKGLELLRQAEHLAGNDTRIKSNLKIASTIAIRENLSGYLKNSDVSPPITEKPPLPAPARTPPDLMQTPPESVPGEIPGIEVSNGNGTAGMAKRGADFLRGHGFTVRSVTNANHFRFTESVIYYRKEHLQTARDLAAVIPGAQNLEEVESMAKPAIGIRVLLGRDLAGRHFPEDGSKPADYRSTRQPTPAVAAASNFLVN